MSVIERYEALKRVAERLQRDKDRAEGAVGQLYDRLREQYAVKTLKEAKQLLKKAASGKEAAAEKAEEVLTKLEEDYGDYLR